jgi:deoxyribonuclease-4
MRIGRHMPVGSHATQALQLTQQIGGDTLQIFVTNPRAWQPLPPNPLLRPPPNARRGLAGRLWFTPHTHQPRPPRDDICARHPRPCAARKRLARKRRLHIGSHTGSGEEAGLSCLARARENTANALTASCSCWRTIPVAVENWATVWRTWRVLDQASQYALNLASGYRHPHHGALATMLGRSRACGRPSPRSTARLARVPVHVNDAREALGSHRDVHARLGEGQIALEGCGHFCHPACAHDRAAGDAPEPAPASQTGRRSAPSCSRREKSRTIVTANSG